MAVIAFTCGHCKNPTVGKTGQYSQTKESATFTKGEDNIIDLSVECGSCSRLSIIHFYFYDGIDDGNRVNDFISSISSESILNEIPLSQSPNLIRNLPKGAPFKLLSAWHEAERAFSGKYMPTVATIAYRRVLESAAKLIEAPANKDRIPLGARMKKLLENGIISQELYDLSERALKFGNSAAHEADALTPEDASIARDLAEAFLRQAYSVPHLLQDAENALNNRNNPQEMNALANFNTQSED